MASVWGGDSPSVAWGHNSWQSNTVTISLTAPSGLTSSIGSITPIEMSVGLSGQAATSSVGSISVEFVTLTAPSQMTSSVGDFDNAGTLVGWGRNGWGEEPYGDSWNKLIQPTGLSATSSVGTITPADVVGVTGLGATSAVGTPTLDITSVEVLTAPSALTASVGSITPTEMVVGLTGQAATCSVGGIILDAVEIGLTGQEAISSVGEPAVLGYADVDIEGNTSYTDVTKNNTGSYSNIDISGNTSYTDVDHAAQEKFMASSYTNLGVELMTTGEKAGQWGTITNTNLNIIEQITGGYVAQALTDGGTLTLSKTDGGTGATVATRVWKLTGALTGSSVVTVPDSLENWYIAHNASTGAQTVQLKTATGTGTTWATTDKGHKIVYTDGTNIVDPFADFSEITLSNQNSMKFADADNSHYVAFKAPATVSSSVTWTLPDADATASGQALTSNSAGTLSWATAGITTGKAIAMAMIFG